MKPLVLVQTVFCPTRKMLNFQLKSLESLANFLKVYPRDDIDIIFAGFIEDEYYKEFVSNVKQYFWKKCNFIRFEKNYGKAYVVNSVLASYLKDNNTTKHIFTFDSDICFYTDSDIITRLIKTQSASNAGLVACNFTGDNAHWIDKFEHTKLIGNELVKFPTTPAGIAGGCIFMPVEAWKKTGGYRVMGVYAPDDAVLIHDMTRNGYFICVAASILVHHPGTHDDPHYQNWKQKTSASIKTFDAALEHCDNFWEKTKTMEEGFKKLELPNVTLAIVDCVNVNRAITAIEYCEKEINFGKIKILTSIDVASKYEAIKIDKITSKEQYSEFCIKELNKHIDTDYVLLIQFDGFVIGGKKAWNPEFLKYDYIGAPWNYYDDHNVGNGGFSLRSKKLLRILANEPSITEYHPEDNLIGRKYRPLLESRGIKFAPEDLAWKFAIECGSKHGWDYKGQFGFHGFDVINHNKIKL